ncbi:hypothetical protein ES705_16290 [subsurface metagenome]
MFFIRSFEAMYQYVNEAMRLITVYIDESIAAIPEYDDTALTEYIDAQVAALNESIAALPKYVDRGHVTEPDFTKADLTLDGDWYDLDLSGIIPVGTTDVLLGTKLQSGAMGGSLMVHTPNTDDFYNVDSTQTLADWPLLRDSLFVSCDANRIIRYYGTFIYWETLDITVRGWIK